MTPPPTPNNNRTIQGEELLLPCPFCGSFARFANGFDNGAGVSCTNRDCEASVFYVGAETWNRRAPSKEVAAFVGLLKRLDKSIASTIHNYGLRLYDPLRGLDDDDLNAWKSDREEISKYIAPFLEAQKKP